MDWANEVWDYTLPFAGAQIRVKRPLYYHHGIYVGNNQVIHFGNGDINDTKHPELNTVHQSSVEEFLDGGLLEVRVYSKDEKKKLLSTKKIIENAINGLGRKGYDFLKDNCEHFSNECAFGIKYSAQTNKLRGSIRELL